MVQDIASAYSMVSQTLATIKNATRFAAVLAFVIRVPLNFLSCAFRCSLGHVVSLEMRAYVDYTRV